MNDSKLNSEITSILVNTLPNSTTLEELKKICSLLVQECNTIIQQSENIAPILIDNSISPTVTETEKSLSPSQIRIVQLPIDIFKINKSFAESPNYMNLINFLNSELVNCEIGSSIMATQFYKKYNDWCKKKSIIPITNSMIRSIMKNLEFCKTKYSGTQKFIGIK